ncbi:MAG: sodium/solute symporter [Acidobacteriota bacterium]
MGLLSLLDLTVIVSYFAGITWIGARFYRKSAGMQEYLLGSRGMKWLPVALSILAADTSAISYLGVPAWSFQHDMKLNQNILTLLLAIPIVIWLFVPIYSRGNLFTAYQYLERRFDLRVRLLASLFFLVVRGAHVAVIIYAPSLMMAELMQIPLGFSIIAIGALTAFYTMLGGIRAVIWTDAIQVLMVLVGFTTVSLSVLFQVPGGLGGVLHMGALQGKFEFFDFSFNLSQVDNSFAILFGGTILTVQAMSTDQAVLQKYFTTKSAKETSKSLVLYGVVIIPLTTLLSILGVMLFVFYSNDPELRSTLRNPDAIVPHYVANILPHGLAGLVVASIFAGSMSTVSASLNSLATSSVVDVYKRIVRPGRSDQHYTAASRWATCLWGALATLGAFYVGRLGALVTAFAKIQSLIGGIILGIFLLGILTKRTTSSGVIAGSIGGLGVVLYVFFFTRVSLFWYCVIGSVGTLLVGWLYSLAVPKIEADLQRWSTSDKL